MTAALTGATGLIGAAVLRHLSSMGPVQTIGRRAGNDLIADLADPGSVEKLDLAGCDTLVHCAGIVDEDFSDPEKAFRQATLGMAALVSRAKSQGVRRFAYISSAHVYGRFTGTISEASPPNPLHDYAIAHFASEQILQRATGTSFRAAVIRPCAVFGIPPDLGMFRRWTLIPFDFPRCAIQDGVIKLASRGTQRRNFVGTEDIAGVVATWLADGDIAPFTPINPIGGESMTVLAFAERCAEIAERVTGRSCRITRPDTADPQPDLFDYTTCDRRNIRSADLNATVELLMRLLAESGKTRGQ